MVVRNRGASSARIFDSILVVETIFVIAIVSFALLPLKPNPNSCRVLHIEYLANLRRGSWGCLPTDCWRGWDIRGRYICRQVGQLDTELRKSVWRVRENVLIDRRPPNKQALLPVPRINNYVFGKLPISSILLLRAEYHLSFSRTKWKVKRIRKVGEEGIGVRLNNNVSRRSVSSIIPQDGYFLTDPLTIRVGYVGYNPSTHLWPDQGHEGSLGAAFDLACGIGNLLELISENSQQAGKQGSPKCGRFQNLPDFFHGIKTVFLYAVAVLSLWGFAFAIVSAIQTRRLRTLWLVPICVYLRYRAVNPIHL